MDGVGKRLPRGAASEGLRDGEAGLYSFGELHNHRRRGDPLQSSALPWKLRIDIIFQLHFVGAHRRGWMIDTFEQRSLREILLSRLLHIFFSY